MGEIVYRSILLAMLCCICSCADNDEETYVALAATPVSPVSVDLSKVPYDKLSDYHFFEGDMKNLQPALNVLPFQPASSLFTDYAHKKRFVWMPPGRKAVFKSDNAALELPVGAVLIKNFYYENVQNISPAGGTRIIETRLMIRTAVGWIFADYVWNDEQTEAYSDLRGSVTPITWKDEHNIIKSVDYRIPAEAQCLVCHKKKEMINDVEITLNIPIGVKPQNLNFDYAYATENKNQLAKWIEQGYLKSNFAFPTPEHTVIDYNDTSKSLSLRARSYVDSNCSHCHAIERHCDYRPMRFGFSETADRRNMGVCVATSDTQDFPSELGTIVTPGSVEKSMLYYRLNTTNETYRMPLHGRTIIHEEGVALMAAWINSLEPCN